MNITKPVCKQEIIVQDMGRESLLYDPVGMVFHILNPTAKLIWEFCDGTHSIEDMEWQMRERFSVAKEHNVVEDIKETLNILSSKRLLDKIPHYHSYNIPSGSQTNRSNLRCEVSALRPC